MDTNYELVTQPDLHTEQVDELSILPKILGGTAIKQDDGTRNHITPPTYPNDREWAQMNLLS